MTTCSKLYLLGTLGEESPTYSQGSQEMSSTWSPSPQLELSSLQDQFRLTGRRSRPRSGTRRGRRGTAPSPPPTTGGPWAPSSSTTLPSTSLTRTSRGGSGSSGTTPTPTSSSCWWETSLI